MLENLFREPSDEHIAEIDKRLQRLRQTPGYATEFVPGAKERIRALHQQYTQLGQRLWERQMHGEITLEQYRVAVKEDVVPLMQEASNLIRRVNAIGEFVYHGN